MNQYGHPPASDRPAQRVLGDFIAQDLKLNESPATPRRQLPWYRQAFQEDYLDIYMHRDLAEAAHAVRFLARALALADTQRLLDLCCGPGRHLAFLRNHVKQAVGLDLSRVLLTRAKANCRVDGLWNEETGEPRFLSRNPQSAGGGGAGENARGPREIQSQISNFKSQIPNPESVSRNPQLVQADMRRLPLAAGAFERVVNLFTSFGYFENEADNAAVLGEIARVLRPGGLLALDHINREAMLAHLKPRTERVLPDGRRLVEKRRYEEGTRRVIKDVACTEPGGQVSGWTESVRVYAPEELAGMLGAAGLTPRMRYGDYDGGSWRPDAPRLILIAEKARPASG